MLEELSQLYFLFPALGPTVLRIAAALVFASIAENFYRRRVEIANGPFPLVQKPGSVIAWTAFLTAAAVSLLLAIGDMTRLAAILGAAISIKACILSKHYPSIFPHGRTAYFLLAVLSLVLVAAGGGAFAIDTQY